MLTDSQLFRLQDVLGCLACYANDLFGLVEHEQFLNLMESYDPARVEVIHDVLETLWENTDIIDGFVEKNPFGLSPDDLQLALSWKDALHATGVFVGTEEGRELYLVEGRLVALAQAELHESGPCLVNITVLPFENMLVEDYTSMAMDLDVRYAAFPLQRDVARARGLGILETPQQFVPFSREINGRRHEAEMNRLMDDLDRESRLHAGEDISPEGFHRGRFAGLSREERDRLADEEARSVLLDQLLAMLKGRLIKKAAPTPQLDVCLANCTKATLEEFGQYLGVRGLTSLNKGQATERLMDVALAAMPQTLDALLGTAAAFPAVVLQQLQQQAAEGPLVRTVTPATLDNSTVGCFPFVLPFLQEGQLVGVMPEEMRDLLLKLDLPALAAQSQAQEDALRVTEECLFTYGLTTVEDAYHELELLGLDALSAQEFDGLVRRAAEDGALDGLLWQHGSSDYLVSPPLLPQPDTTQARDERRYLLECHANVPRKHLYEFAKDGRVEEAAFTGEAAEKLASYLNERVPDGQNDAFFADNVLEELILAVVENNVDVAEMLAIAEEFGLMGCDTEPERLLGRLAVLRNSLPLWELNGWSAIESMELQTGKKMFFDDRGVPLKVGRNDPCPCGSGKLYKDCCGK